jgi:BspA type Leucine rich repeat region (6 copies)
MLKSVNIFGFRCIAALLLLCLPAVVQAQFTFTTNGNSITITRYTGPGGAVAIPSATNGYPVTVIGQQAFYNSNLSNTNIVTSVTIPNSITNIGQEAFESCTRLSSLTVPNSVQSIGFEAFYTCGLTNITILTGSNNLTIGGNAFSQCPGLTSITIPANVTALGGGTFESCSYLKNVCFLGNAPSGSANIFTGDPTTVYYLFGTANWGSLYGNANTVEETAPTQFDYSTNDGSIIITKYTGSGGTVVIPDLINGYSVTGIADDAFENCYTLTNAIILPSVTSIGEQSFYACSGLINVTILAAPGGATTIGQAAFENCYGLTNVVIPNTVTIIGDDAFADCTNLISASFLGNAPPDDGTVFDNDPITVSYVFGTVGWSTMFGGAPTVPTEVDYVVTNGTVTITGYSGIAFTLVIPSTLNGYPITSIGDNAFENLGLTSVIISPGVINIGNSVFYLDGYLSNVVIPNTVTSIGSDVFTGCSGLTSITIPNSVTNVESSAFNDNHLTSAYFQGNAPLGPGVQSAFNGDPATVYYLPGTTGWGAKFGGVPAVLWNPQATNFTAVDSQFGFNITGPTNATIVVEACTNLANPVWLPVSTNTLSSSGTSAFSDSESAVFSNRYYRFSSP